MRKKSLKSTAQEDVVKNSVASGGRVKLFEHWHWVAFYLMLFDLAAVTFSYFCALWLRFDCHFSEIPQEYLMAWLKFAPIYGVVSIVVFWAFHL